MSLTDEQKQEIHNQTGAGHALICLVESAATAPLLERIAELERERDQWKDDALNGGNAAYLREQLEKIKRVGSCGSVDSWMTLTDQQKRDWFAVTLARDTQQCNTIKQQAEELETLRKDAGWRPIETAPKDGTAILVNDTTPGYTPWVAASYSEGDEWSGWRYDDATTEDGNPLGPNPTHWMPLPPAPDAAKDQG